MKHFRLPGINSKRNFRITGRGTKKRINKMFIFKINPSCNNVFIKIIKMLCVI